MLAMLSKNWWVVALRGVIAILFGIALLLFPPLVITTMVLFFGAYALVDGVAAIFTAIQNRNQPRWWVTLLEGLIGVVAGILVFLYPAFATISAALFVLYIVAFWSIFTGITEIMAAIQLRKEIEGEFWMGLSGALSLVFGIVLLVMNPVNGILAIVTIVAVYAIAFGVILLLLAFRLRSHNQSHATPTSTGTRQPV
ncbi:MAG: HdeD family acid-resistance protein [Anaerolineae bacterium]|nr:HdeD family acid-resistance protein [Anaerolineae bacterium]